METFHSDRSTYGGRKNGQCFKAATILKVDNLLLGHGDDFMANRRIGESLLVFFQLDMLPQEDE